MIVTDRMDKAGMLISEQALEVYRYHHMQIGDEEMDWSQYGEHAELLEIFQMGQISTARMIYLAMEKAK